MERLGEIIRQKLDDIPGKETPGEEMVDVSTDPESIEKILTNLRDEYDKKFDEALEEFESE